MQALRADYLEPMQEVWLDQEDVQLLHEGEEFTLMDWGNAVVEARLACLILACLVLPERTCTQDCT